MSAGILILAVAATVLLAAGVGLLWLRGRSAVDVEGLLSRAVSAEARVDELRAQLKAAGLDLAALQGRLSELETSRSAAEAKLQEATRSLAERQKLLDDVKSQLPDLFKSLASDVLQHSSAGFLTLAEQKFRALSDGARSDLDSRKRAIEEILDPVKAALLEYQQQARDLEAKRLTEISAVSEQLRSLSQAQHDLQQETGKLVNALKSPQVRGRWGEIALRKTAELAGMSRHCDFIEQPSVPFDGSRLRPDMVVKLPAGREVVVDSKVPLAGFLESLEATSDEERAAALTRHVTQLKQHVLNLSSKEYWNQFGTTPEFVVLFIPNDSFLAAAAERDPGIVESALRQNVVIATPTTFIALLRAIAFGWRQEAMAQNAKKIAAHGQELADRLATVTEHVGDLGRALSRSVETYNAAVGSFESRLLPLARRFRELGAEGKKQIPELATLEETPRELSVAAESSESNARG